MESSEETRLAIQAWMPRNFAILLEAAIHIKVLDVLNLKFGETYNEKRGGVPGSTTDMGEGVAGVGVTYCLGKLQPPLAVAPRPNTGCRKKRKVADG